MRRSKKRIRLSGPAARDLANIGAYTQKEWGKRQKAKYLTDIKRTLAELRDIPGLGADRGNIEKGMRSHPAGKHIVYDRNTKSALVIVRVLHQRMDLDLHLGRERK